MVIGTFEWSSFRIIRKVPRSDALILVMVSGVTVFADLAVAVVVGVIASALVFAWQHAKYIRIEAREDHKVQRSTRLPDHCSLVRLPRSGAL